MIRYPKTVAVRISGEMYSCVQQLQLKYGLTSGEALRFVLAAGLESLALFPERAPLK